jgi:Zn-dependent protease with chaperone function
MTSRKRINILLLLVFILIFLFTIAYCISSVFLYLYLIQNNGAIVSFYVLPVICSTIIILTKLFPRKVKTEFTVDINNDAFDEYIRTLEQKLNSRKIENRYFVFEQNAFAFLREKKTSLAIGLPLLVELSTRELMAVVAHETAHHLHGEVRNNRFVHAMNSFIIRLFLSMNRIPIFLTSLPYLLFNYPLFRVIRKYSREFEYDADRVSASIIGKGAMITALKKLHQYRYKWNDFCENWIIVFRRYAVYPELTEAYREYLKADRVDEDDRVYRDFASRYDTHPTVYERIKVMSENTELEETVGKIPDFGFDTVRPSIRYWEETSGVKTIHLTASINEAFALVVKNVIIEYGYLFMNYRFRDITNILKFYIKMSYSLYEKTLNDDFDFEKKIISRILSYIIFETGKITDYTLSKNMTPVLSFNGNTIDLFAVIMNDFECDDNGTERAITALGFDLEAGLTEKISYPINPLTENNNPQKNKPV